MNNSKTDYNADIDLEATWDASSARAHWRDRPAGAPFFAQFTTLTTHEASIFAARRGRTPIDAVRIPPFYPDTPTTRTDKAQYYDRIAQMDGELAQRLAELETDGLAGDTIVFFFSDNGGVLPWSKRFANDRGLRVPLIVRIPEKRSHLVPAPPGSVVRTPIDFADFAPAVLSLTGVATPDYMQGAAFLGRSRRKKSYAFGQRSRMNERYDLQRTPLQERFWGEKPSEELYDLRKDPDALHNLARDAGRRRVLRRLRQALDKHMRKIKDNGFIPEGSPLEGYEQSRARGAYPLRRVMRIAWRAIARHPRHLDGLVAGLGDANEVVRYWAAQGVVMLEDAGRPAAAALEERLAGDPSVHVRVVAAEALARMGDTGRPLGFLAETLDTHDDPRVRLLALNALTHLPIAALEPYADAMGRAAGSPDQYVASAARYLQAVVSGTYDPRTPP